MDDQAPPTTDELSDRQQLVLYVLLISSGSLSLIGSSTIAFKILRNLALKRSMTPYDRIILCLSTVDILSIINFAINAFLLPSATGIVWAFGSAATCQAAGVLSLSLVWSQWYNCILIYYFLLTVLSQVRFLYAGFFLLSITPFIIMNTLQTSLGFTNDNPGMIFPLLVLNTILFPLQGFFNVFIYIKPTYIRFRTAIPSKPMYYVLYQALFNPDVPQLTASSELDNGFDNISIISDWNPSLKEAAANPNQVNTYRFNSNSRPRSSRPRSSSSDSSASSKKESSEPFAIAEGSNEEDSDSEASGSGPFIYTHSMPRVSELRF